MHAGTNVNDRPQPIVAPTRRDYILCCGFVLVWLLPMAFTGLTGRSVPRAPRYLNNQYRVSCFFTDRVTHWSEFYFQARFAGSTEWSNLHESDFSKLEPFGHRSRLHRMLSANDDEGRLMLLRQRMSEFIKDRHETLYPRKPVIDAVRFLIVNFATGDELAQTDGPWRHRPLQEISKDRQIVVSTHYFDGRPPIGANGRAFPLVPDGPSVSKGFDAVSR